jgi:hypothetical protein
MGVLALILRTLGLPVCIITGLLAYYEGFPFLRDIPFADRIPVVRELITGRVAAESAKAAEAARKGYVQEVRATAAEAKADELQRQVDAGAIVISSYQEIAKNARAAEQQTAADAEQRISDYEKLLQTAGRKCPLDQSDLDWLSR